MASDPFFSPVQMPNGTVVSGSAAFNHRVKLAGGPTGFANRIIENTLHQVDMLAKASVAKKAVANTQPRAKTNVVPMKRRVA